MDKKEFYEWLKENEIEVSFADCGGYPSDTMQFSKNGKWFLNVRANVSYFDIQKAITGELDGIHPQYMIENILTFKEASEKWGLNDSTLRKLVTTDKLKEGIDYRKSGNVWLITKKAMESLYGKLE